MPELIDDTEYVPGPVEEFLIAYLKEALGINEE